MTAFWLAYRYFGSWRKFFNLSTVLSIVGMTIGVGTLVVSMAVFSGYTQTLERTVQDTIGHLTIYHLKSSSSAKLGEISEDVLKEVRPLITGFVAETPFVQAEGMLAHGGKINSVGMEGVDQSTIFKVLNLNLRLISGQVDFSTSAEGNPKALIGKGIAEKFGLKVGDVFRIVIPLSKDFQTNSFRRKLGKFEVAGVINFGRYDYDIRYILVGLPQLQEFAELGHKPTGFRVRISDPELAHTIAQNISDKFHPEFAVADWYSANRILFEASRLEKRILFFVLMILVVAAAFNIANTLFISVVRRYHDISVLKTLGATNGLVRMVFSAQGLMVGAVGSISGVAVGLFLCRVLVWIQMRWQIVPREVYKLDYIEIHSSFSDIFMIVGTSLAICFLATLVPSHRGSQVSPVEGLRYE
jgi:lipoprotein-releasing system permease protein